MRLSILAPLWRAAPPVALAVSLVVLLALARPASAQGPAYCCLPDGSCVSKTPYECHVLGGFFLPGAEACPEPCDRSGIGMSQTAARRLAREGVVHTLYADDFMAVYSSTAASMNSLWALLDQGAVIAPQIAVDLRHYAGVDVEAHVQDLLYRIDTSEPSKEGLVRKLAAAKAAWDTAHPAPNTRPFYWALRLEALGASYVNTLGAGSVLPDFANHPLDVLPNKVSSRHYLSRPGSAYARIASNRLAPTNTVELTYLNQFNPGYFTLPVAAHIKVGDTWYPVTGYANGVFEVDGTLPVDPTGTYIT